MSATFHLSIRVTHDAVAEIKRDIGRQLVEVKSSHMTEAIARAIGYHTHASFLADDAIITGELKSVSGTRFAEFLADRVHGIDSVPLYRAAARVAIADVISREPRLTHWGYGVGRPQRIGVKLETAEEHYSRFLVERQALLAESSIEEFLRALAFVQKIERIQRINRRSGSYGLKHKAEKLDCTYPEGQPLGPAYVSNGALIVAAVHAGFDYKSFSDILGYDHVNVAFNMSQKSLNALESLS